MASGHSQQACSAAKVQALAAPKPEKPMNPPFAPSHALFGAFCESKKTDQRPAMGYALEADSNACAPQTKQRPRMLTEYIGRFLGL